MVHRTTDSWGGTIVNGAFSTLEKAQDYIMGEVLYNYSKDVEKLTDVAKEILEIQNFLRVNRDLGWVKLETVAKIRFSSKVSKFYFKSIETDWFDVDDDFDQKIVELCYSLGSYNIHECELDNV